MPPQPRAKYMTFQKPAGTTGIQNVTGLDFVGVALILWSDRQAWPPLAGVDGAKLVIGMTDGTRQVSRSIDHPDNQTATTSAQAEKTDCVVWLSNASATQFNNPAVARAVFTGFTSTGFTLDWTVNSDPTASLFHCLVFGNSAVNPGPTGIHAKLVQQKITVGTGGNIPVTGLGFAPKGFIVLGGAADELGAGDYSNGAPFGSIHGFGFSDAVTTNICGWTLGLGTAVQAINYRGEHPDRCASIRVADQLGAAELCGIQINTPTSDGFNITRVAGTTGNQPIEHILCLGGINIAMTEITTPATASTITFSVGFTAEVILLQTCGLSTVTGGGMGLSIGVWQGGVGGGTWIGGIDGSSPSIYARASFTDAILRFGTAAAVAASSVLTLQVTVPNVSGLNATLMFNPVPATPVKMLGVAIGLLPVPIDPIIPPQPTILAKVWAQHALPDPEPYYHGWKEPRVLEWGPIRRALSDINGQYEGSVWTWLVDDVDHSIRTLAGDYQLFNARITGRCIMDPDRRQLKTPRTIFRGLLRNWSPQSGGTFSFEAEDHLTNVFQIGLNEAQVPKRVITRADFQNCPDQNLGRPVPIIYGDLNDETSSTPPTQQPPATVVQNLTATVVGPAGTATYSYGVTALDNRNGQQYDYTKSTDHAGESVATYVTVTGAPQLSEMSASRYVKLDWTDVPGAVFYRIYGRAAGQTTTLNLLDAANAPTASSIGERYNDGERNGITEVDRENTASHPPAGTVTITNPTDTGAGMVPAIYVGEKAIIGGVKWHEFLICGHEITKVYGVYQASDTKQNPAGVEGPEAVTGGVRLPGELFNVGGWIVVPTYGNMWSTYLGPTNYVVYNGNRYTVMYAAGTWADRAASGEAPFLLNLRGIPIDSLIDQYLHVMQNWVIGDYHDGGWLPSPKFTDDPMISRLDENSFAEARVVSVGRTDAASEGDLRGYVGAMHFGLDGNSISVREAIAQMNLNCDVQCGFNQKCQFMVSMLKEGQKALVVAPEITQIRDILKESFSIEAVVDEFFNDIPYSYRYHPAKQAFLSVFNAIDQDSIIAAGETRTAPNLELRFVYDQLIAEDIVNHLLKRSASVPPPLLLRWQMGMAGLNFELGDIVLLTHTDGLGLAGCHKLAVRVHRQDYDPGQQIVSLEGYDVDVFFP
jgi:hypothetical protein